MADAKQDTRTFSEELYQAYGLDGRYSRTFDFEELSRLFEAKYGYIARIAAITAGGGTALLGPVKRIDTINPENGLIGGQEDPSS